MLSQLINRLTTIFSTKDKQDISLILTAKEHPEFTVIITQNEMIASYPWIISPETAFANFSIDLPRTLTLKRSRPGIDLIFFHNRDHINELAYFISCYFKEILHTPPTLNHITIKEPPHL